MFFGRKKKEKKERPTPRWFMWLMAAFIGYALLANLFSDQVEKVTGPLTKQVIDFRPLNDQGWNRAPVPFYTLDKKEGKGKELSCWETPLLDYALYLQDGKLIEDSRKTKKPLQFTIGKGEVITGLERGVLGMKKGGVRHVTIRSDMAYGDGKFKHKGIKPKDQVGFIVWLKDIARPAGLPLNDLGLRVFDDKVGTGAFAQCTDDVTVTISVFDMAGKKIYEGTENPVGLHIGSGIAPYAVERSLSGMRAGGTRTAIVPPGYFRPIFASPAITSDTVTVEGQSAEKEIPAVSPPSNELFPNLKVPETEMVILEIQMLEPGRDK